MTSDTLKEANFDKFNLRKDDGSLDYKAAIRAREEMTREEIAGTFDKWVENEKYESDLDALNYRGPQVTAAMVSQLYKSNRENIKILDVAAGSGLLSKELRQYGFRDIDAVDPSPGSKEAAMKKKLYGRYIVDFVDEHHLDIKTDAYDCVASAGGFAAGLMPCIALKEMIRVVKPGGLVCFSCPDYIFTIVEEYRDRFEPLIERYVTDGYWEKISRTAVENYFNNAPGAMYVYKVLKSEVL